MRILIILPNWLGDTVMATPAIELLAKYHPNAKFTFVGSYVSIQAIKYHPLCEKAIVDETKKSSSRLFATYKLAKKLGKFNLALTFRKQIHSSLLLRFTGTVVCLAQKTWHSMFLLSHTPKIDIYAQHLARTYAKLAMTNVNDWDEQTPPSKLYIQAIKFDKPTLGINGGAAFGGAKQWYPERFAQVGANLSDKYDIVILGAPNEIDIANEIEQKLISLGVKNYVNLAGETDVKELCANIAGCSLMLCNDSGPMHIAAAYQTPTVAVIGPTEFKQTYPWENPKGKIVRLNLECSPCVKRVCPLGHHDCMNKITSDEVTKVAKELNS
ncbi:MAG: lipopolysaccharide heptosyltransferase II [Sulfurimonas sp.]|nr:lipopolysaccharide heptosyltransferase II [Sulfurimonas sp.]